MSARRRWRRWWGVTDASWTLLSTERPTDADAAMICDPADGAALLFSPGDRADGGLRGELWRWHGEGWRLVRRGLLPADVHGAPLAWVEAGAVVLAVAGDDRLVCTTLADAKGSTEIAVPGLRSHMGHTFVFGGGDGLWLIAGDDSLDRSITWWIAGGRAEEVARGPYLVRAAIDPRSHVPVGQDVSECGYRYSSARREWRADATLDGKLDTLSADPERGQVVGLMVRSDDRMELVGHDGAEWQVITPEVWLPVYRNEMRLVFDRRTRQWLAFGGQDFDNGGGAPSAATWYGEAGELREVVDPAAPSWGRYNALMTTSVGVLAFNYSAKVLSRRSGETWVRVAEIAEEHRGDLDDRYLNVVWVDGFLMMFQARGALMVWRPGLAPIQLAPPTVDEDEDEEEFVEGAPRPAYSHRTAIGWDPRGSRVVVASGDCGRGTFVAEGGSWRALDAKKFAGGRAALMATTPVGLVALTHRSSKLLVGDRWVRIGEGLESARGIVWEPRRGALMVGDHGHVWLGTTSGGWRRVIGLPDGARLGEMGGRLAVDPKRDELLIVDGTRVWVVALAGIDWADAGLPVVPER